MKTLKLTVMALAAIFTLGLASCSDSKDEPNNGGNTNLSEGDKLLQEVLAQNVDGNINYTYKMLADSTNQLYTALQQMREASKANGVTQEMVNDACDKFLKARSNYEKSEAFLLGAAADFSIDPHIDSWPLDLSQLLILFESPKMIENLDSEDGPEIAYNSLGQSLLGFHGIEFILFRNGQPRNAAELNANGHDSYNEDNLDFTQFTGEYELIYATAVCGDLRNNVYRLETSWNAEAPKSHFDIMDALEWSTVTTTSGISYGENMKKAGVVGSTYTSVKNAVSAVLVGDGGAAGISDEVGNVKINNPFSGEDVSYIESPYSHNSLTDFWNNIQSIKNTWMGGRPESRNSAKSFEAYFKKYAPEINTEVEEALDDAQAKIYAIPAPFVLNYSNAKCREAIEACQKVTNALNKANNFIQNTNK